MNILLAKILISLNLLSVALAALPSNNMVITPDIALQGQNLGVYGAIYRYFDPDKVETALKVAFAESRLDPRAINQKSTAKGIFQILNGTWKHYGCLGDPFDIEDNVKCASIIAKDDWSAWNASKSSWSK